MIRIPSKKSFLLILSLLMLFVLTVDLVLTEYVIPDTLPTGSVSGASHL